MNKAEFLKNNIVNDFIDFFSRCMHNLEVSYVSDYPRIDLSDRSFHVTGVEDALASYAWPAEDTFSPKPHKKLYDWASTSAFLGTARAALHGATDESITWDAAVKILQWGLNPNGVNDNINQLENITNDQNVNLYEYFEGVRHSLILAHADTGEINANLIPYASSGICKIHSLASTDGLIIFDSRVAATLGECINEFLRRVGAEKIPDYLKIFVERRHNKNNPGQRLPRPLMGGANHTNFRRDHSWIECQVRVSWIFEEALTRQRMIFSELSMPERMHRLEASCFMMGAYLVPGPFNGRSFNFNRVS